MKHRIVIRRDRPWLRPLIVVLGMAMAALAAWGLYVYTRASTVVEFEQSQIAVEQMREERRALLDELQALRKEIKTLKGQVAYEQQASQIDVEACESVRRSLSTLQGETVDLREQLAFYRGIVSPDLSRSGVRIYQFTLKPTGFEGEFDYELVLIQSIRNERRVSGRVDFSIEGASGRQPKTLPWSDVAVGASKNLLFSFRYFEEFTGRLRLPASFKPLRVVARLSVEGSSTPVDDQFDWAKHVVATETD